MRNRTRLGRSNSVKSLIIGTQSESQTLPQYQPKKACVFSVWALHYS
ncbi:hypothetical protein HMPREF1417_00589 [Helicobacter pylori GAM260Bi]|nr:hypothetical protein HMPREF1397_00087 [Helicobacter pylori GAM115Ai]EMH20884.1 hypothetical protein HMPREF1417_00589 [Helicobacter pylori GAM260Bi]EMH70548.1 hypothetical protein HMPREF1452_01064 [Helicobacter pylori HP260Bi]